MLDSNASHLENDDYSTFNLNDTSEDYHYSDIWMEIEGLGEHIAKSLAGIRHLYSDILAPFLLAVGLAVNFPLLVLSVRKAVVKFYYPSIYFTAISIFNIIELSARAYFHVIHAFKLAGEMSSFGCKFSIFLYYFATLSRFILLTILVLDRCLFILGSRLESTDVHAWSRIRAMSKSVCGKTSTQLITVLVAVLMAGCHMFIWWTIKNDDYYCDYMHEEHWELAFRLTFKFFCLLSVLTGCVYIILLHIRSSRISVTLQESSKSVEFSTEATDSTNRDSSLNGRGSHPEDTLQQDSMILISLCLAIGFIVSEILIIAHYLMYDHGLHNNQLNSRITYPLLWQVVKIAEYAIIIEIPVVFAAFLHRLLIRETRHMFGEMKDLMLRIRGRVPAPETDGRVLFETSSEAVGINPDVDVQDHCI